MAGEAEVLVVPARRWRRFDVVRLFSLPVGAVIAAGAALHGSWGWSLYFGVCFVVGCATMWRWPRRRVECVDEELVVFNPMRTWRFPLHTVREVYVGKSMNGACVFIRGEGNQHCIDATLGMNREQLEATAATINAAVAAHSTSVG